MLTTTSTVQTTEPLYYTIPKNTMIGKCLDASAETMYPNTNFLKCFPEAELPETQEIADRSSCLRIGAFIVIRKVIAEYHLDEIIGHLIGKESGLFLDLAAYSIVTETNAGQYYPDYAYNHPLFTQGMKLYSDSKVSSFINGITRDPCIAFQNEWNNRNDHREKIYITYDTTDKNCQADDLECVEVWHPKDDDGKPILNYSIVYAITTPSLFTMRSIPLDSNQELNPQMFLSNRSFTGS